MDTPDTAITPAKKTRTRKKRTPEQLAAEVQQQRVRRGMALIDQALTLKEGERKCGGTSAVRDAEGNKINGPDGKWLRKPCGNPPIKGGTVCKFHGGGAKQVKAAANRRMQALVEPAIARLGLLIQQDTHLATSLGAIRTVLERADGGAIGALKTKSEETTRPQIIIGIKVGGIATPTVEVGMQQKSLPAGDDEDFEEGEIVDNDD